MNSHFIPIAISVWYTQNDNRTFLGCFPDSCHPHRAFDCPCLLSSCYFKLESRSCRFYIEEENADFKVIALAFINSSFKINTVFSEKVNLNKP